MTYRIIFCSNLPYAPDSCAWESGMLPAPLQTPRHTTAAEIARNLSHLTILRPVILRNTLLS